MKQTFAITFKPGIHRETTRFNEQGNWWDCNRVRWRDGKAEVMRGYSQHYGTTFEGTARDLKTWNNNDGERLVSWGTEKKLYAGTETTFYDITPIVSTASWVSAVAVSSGSTLVSISAGNHNLSEGDFILIADATSVGGILLSGVYEILSVTDIHNFVIDSETTATLTSSSAGGTISASYLLPTGLTTAIAGLGYGAGVYQAGASTTGERAWNVAASSSDITLLNAQWSLDNWGEDMVACRRGGRIYLFDQDASVTPERAVLVTASPSVNDFIIVSPVDRHLISLGATGLTDPYSPLRVRWCDQANYNNWTPSVSSTAGEKLIQGGSKIVGAVRSQLQLNIFTDTGAHAMEWTGGPQVFRFRQLGSHCGLVGPHAAVDLDSATYWMSQSNFYKYDGRVVPLECPIKRYIFDRLNYSQRDKVFAGTNSEFYEVMWLYPSTNSTECDSYVIYNIMEDAWYFGSTAWTTLEDIGIFENTLTACNAQYLWDNEPKGIYTGNGADLQSYLESADFDVAEGENVIFVDRLIPDFKISKGVVNFSLTTLPYPNGPTVVKGPYEINSLTQKIDLRARGRQARIRISATDDTDWREGHMRLRGKDDGTR